MIRHWTNMLVAVAPDCPVERGVVPEGKRGGKPAHVIQYELLSQYPYQYTFEEQLFEVFLQHKGYEELSDQERSELRMQLLSKSHPCMRASMLPKKYGWGVHYNDDGKIAIYGMESETYQDLLEAGRSGGMELQIAMRSKRT